MYPYTLRCILRGKGFFVLTSLFIEFKFLEETLSEMALSLKAYKN